MRVLCESVWSSGERYMPLLHYIINTRSHTCSYSLKVLICQVVFDLLVALNTHTSARLSPEEGKRDGATRKCENHEGDTEASAEATYSTVQPRDWIFYEFNPCVKLDMATSGVRIIKNVESPTACWPMISGFMIIFSLEWVAEHRCCCGGKQY